MLAELQQPYPIVYRWNVVEQVGRALLPEPEKLRIHSLRDAECLAVLNQHVLPKIALPETPYYNKQIAY